MTGAAARGHVAGNDQRTTGDGMKDTIGSLEKMAISAGIGVIGLVGLFFASRAQDGGIYYGGLLIFVIAVGYIFWQIKRAMDEGDQQYKEQQQQGRPGGGNQSGTA